MGSAIKKRAGSIWDDMKKSMEEMGEGNESLGGMMVGKTLSGLVSGTESMAASLKKGTEDLIANFMKGSDAINANVFGLGGPSAPEEPPEPKKRLVIDINTPRGTENAAPSHFEKALIDANTNIRKSFMDLNLEREKLQNGFSTLSPEILKLAQKHGELDGVVRALSGDFSGLNEAGLRIFTMAVKVNEAFLDFGRRKEAICYYEKHSYRTCKV